MGRKNKNKKRKIVMPVAKNATEVSPVEKKEALEKKTVDLKSQEVKPTQTNIKAVEKKKVKKENRGSKIVKRLKETGSELKKVSWPKFPKVVKQTGVVLAVVVFFGLVLFGIDYLLRFLFQLLIG